VKKMALLGLDVGTTSTKAVLFDETRTELAQAISKPYQNHSPQPGWVEQDPEEVWQAVLSVLRGVIASVEDQVQVRGVCMAVQSGSLIPANERGEPVYPLITWMDRRTEHLVDRWKEAGFQERIRLLSGWSLYPGLCLPTIAWIQENFPYLSTAARHYFSLNDFIAFRLTGERISNPSNAGGMQLVDIKKADWSEELCTLAKITPAQLSTIQPAGSVIGEVKTEICEETGLTPKAILVNGGHDQVVTALGLGIINPGKLLLACGTAWVLTGVTDTPDLENLPISLDLNFHIPPHRWTVSQSLGGLGASLEWWAQQAWSGDRWERFTSIDQELAGTSANPNLFFIPVTGGHDHSTGKYPGGFVGLLLAHQRADMARAIMESAGFELRWALNALEKAKMPFQRLWMVGGAANSRYWPTILANITQLPIHLTGYANWPALGAALLAGLGMGIFETIQSGLSCFNKLAHEIEPDSKMISIYKDYFAAYRAVCTQVRQISKGDF
jgi:xylulokinase